MCVLCMLMSVSVCVCVCYHLTKNDHAGRRTRNILLTLFDLKCKSCQQHKISSHHRYKKCLIVGLSFHQCEYIANGLENKTTTLILGKSLVLLSYKC